MLRTFRKANIEGLIISTVSIVAFVALWEGGAVVLPNSIPSPIETMIYLIDNLGTPGPRGYTPMDHLWVSLYRTLTILVISLAIAVSLGIGTQLSKVLNEFLDTWFQFWLTVPTIVVLLLAMILLGFDDTALIVAVIIIAVPDGLINIWEGIQDLDTNLVEMSRAFNSSISLNVRHIYVPHLLPYIFGSSRYMLGAIWKVVLIGEALGLTRGLGAIIRFWFSQGELVPLIAYLVLFILVIFVIEYGILKPLERRLFKWRDIS